MEKRIIYTLIIFVIFSTTLKSQWYVYQTNTTMALNKIQFINKNTGFAAGGGPIDSAVFFKTTNGGINWIKYSVMDTIVWNWQEIFGLFFVNANTGFVSGRYLRIFKTTDSGLNWQSYIPPYLSITQIYNTIYFIDENTGFIAGRYGYFCKTINGGVNWILAADLDPNIEDMWFLNTNSGYLCASNGVVYKTTNSGLNFSSLYVGSYGLSSISFLNDSTGFVTGYDAWYNSSIYKTTNFGINWNLLYQNSGLQLTDVRFINQNTGYSCGLDIILKTTNSGINWFDISPDNNGYFELAIINDSIIFSSAGGGKIYKTTTGGVWINQISSEVPEEFKISNCYPNPFNSEVKIELAVNKILYNNKKIYLDIFDTKGSLIFKKPLQVNYPGYYVLKLEFTDYASGIYFIRARNENLFSQFIKVVFIK